MTLPILNRLISSSPKAFLLALAVFGTCAIANAQTSPLTQTFSRSTADDNFPFTPSAAPIPGGYFGYFLTVRGASTPPTPEEAYGAGSSNGNVETVTVDFVEKTFNFNSTSNQLSFDMAALSNGNNSKGFSKSSSIDVYLNINRSGFPASPQLQITGNSENGDNFNLGTGKLYTFPSTVTATSLTAILTQSAPPDGTIYTKVIANLPTNSNAGTRVKVRFVINAKNNTSIIIDNVALTSSSSTFPLPVSLTSFNATAQTTGVNLTWATASEKNSAYFDVQRSATGEVYETLGRVAAQGSSSSLRAYEFLDARPLAGQAYYRLRQVDNDGTTAYSPVATARRGAEALTIYPNPSTEAVTLPASLGPVRYRVLNTLGQTMTSGQATGGDRLDLSTLPKGSFFLELTDAAGRHTQRLMRE